MSTNLDTITHTDLVPQAALALPQKPAIVSYGLGMAVDKLAASLAKTTVYEKYVVSLLEIVQHRPSLELYGYKKWRDDVASFAEIPDVQRHKVIWEICVYLMNRHGMTYRKIY